MRAGAMGRNAARRIDRIQKDKLQTPNLERMPMLADSLEPEADLYRWAGVGFTLRYRPSGG